MAAVNLPEAFGYKWAENGTVDAMDDSQYKLGWAFIGPTPPSVEQFNKVLQTLDEKANYINFRRIGNYAEQLTVSGNRALLNTEAGRIVNAGGAAGSTITITLPASASVDNGTSFQINNNGAGTVIVQAPPGTNLFGIGVSTPRTFTLQSGEYITVGYVGGLAWYAWGGVQLASSAGFRFAKGSSGFQQLPTGTLENYGVALNMGVSETRTINLPSSYVGGGVRSLVLTGDGANPSARVAGFTLSTIQIQNLGTALQNVYWRCIGD
jgi:hypothetical protein